MFDIQFIAFILKVNELYSLLKTEYYSLKCDKLFFFLYFVL